MPESKLNTRLSALLFIVFLVSSCARVEKVLHPISKKLISPKKEGRNIFEMNWAKNLDPIHETGNLPIGHGTPLLKDELVYFSDLHGNVTAYNINNGRVKWSHNEGMALSGQLGIYKNKLYYSSLSGRVYCRDLNTQKLDYAIDLKSPIESAPVFHNGRMIFHIRNHKIVTLDASTGKILWQYKRAVPFTTTLQRVSRPKIINNKIVVGFADGYLGSFSIEEGILEWEVQMSNATKFVDVDVTPVLFEGKILASSANGTLKFLNPSNGAQIISTELTPGHTPIVENGRILFGTLDGHFVIMNRNAQVALKKKISKEGISSLVKWKDGYVASTYGSKMYFVDNEYFNPKETWDLGSEFSAVFGELESDSRYLAVYSSRNRLYLFR